MKTLSYRFLLAGTIVLCAAASGYSRGVRSVTERWIWKEPSRRDKPQVQFTLILHRKGNVASGVYSVDEFINGTWQGEDGNQTPFRGRMEGNKIRIEFDPLATVPGYQKDVTYSAPVDGRKPSTALLTLSGQALQWRLTRRPGIEGVPAQLALRRERRK
jgi:hypothetical protein